MPMWCKSLLSIAIRPEIREAGVILPKCKIQPVQIGLHKSWKLKIREMEKC